jgi:molybdate transport system substrate-binding protein
MVGMKEFILAAVAVSGFVFVVGNTEPIWAEDLTIAAAHSLRTPFQEILPMFEKEYGATVNVVYGPEQTLRREMERGALGVDVFLPGAAEEVVNLQAKGLTLNGGPRIYAQTSLVLVMSAASRETAISFHDGLSNRPIRIAIADPKTSTLGKMSSQVLTRLKREYRNRLKLIYAEHSDEILNLVHTGVVDVGIVYRVDAISGGQVRIIDETPAGAHIPVQFGQAVVWTCRATSLGVAEGFFEFLLSPRIQKLLPHYGFDAVPSNGAQGASQSSGQQP